MNLSRRSFVKSSVLAGAFGLNSTAELLRARGAAVKIGATDWNLRQEVKAGVVLGIEDTISAADNVRILERAKSRAVQVYYDVGNSTKGGFDVVKEIRWLGKDRICEFHLKDNPHYLGEGKIDFPAIVNAIADIGFKGWAHLETDAPSNVESDMGRNLRFVRELIDKRNRAGKS